MNDSQNQQEEKGIFEESGIVTGTKRQLTLEAKEAIRNYILLGVTILSGVLVLVFGGFFYFINRVANQEATTKAFTAIENRMFQLHEKVVEAKKDAEQSVGKIKKSEKDILEFYDKLSSMESMLTSTAAFQSSDAQIKDIAKVLAKDPRIVRVYDDLQKQIDYRLSKADKEIQDIKKYYRIDSRSGVFKKREYEIEKQQFLYTFPFNVKHAWVEINENIGKYRFSTEISDKDVFLNVYFTGEPGTRTIKLNRWSIDPGIQYRIWATSF